MFAQACASAIGREPIAMLVYGRRANPTDSRYGRSDVQDTWASLAVIVFSSSSSSSLLLFNIPKGVGTKCRRGAHGNRLWLAKTATVESERGTMAASLSFVLAAKGGCIHEDASLPSTSTMLYKGRPTKMTTSHCLDFPPPCLAVNPIHLPSLHLISS
ncbi:hypothetical protein LX36DRAFT_264837 [Colletotrichum falcatum]|nr:hypothetical protein LX36DRAFT_264837 [Colletotrichum falcatum]